MGQNLIDFKKLIASDRINQIAKGLSTGLSGGFGTYLGGYEKRMRAFVKDLDLKSKDARVKSKEQLDKFTLQLKSTRHDLEKRVITLVNIEAERLNKGFNDLVSKLRTLSAQEQVASKKKATSKKKAASATRPKAKRASSKKSSTASRARKVSSQLDANPANPS